MQKKELSEIITIAEELESLREKKKKELPYQINLIDELHANENAHSRIFLKLIEYNESYEYPFLKSFFKYIEYEFKNIEIKKPKFYNEKGRIDVLIEDKEGEYAIIIENKIHGAPDQDEQINRYIEKCKKNGFKEKQIYVLYLTKGGGSPSKDSLPNKEKIYLGNKYKDINYRDHILPWLRKFAIPYCRVKDTLLTSAIQQYIDHLEGMFHERKIEKKMKKDLELFLKEKFKIKGDEFNEFEQLKERKNKINKVIGFVEEMQKDVILKKIESWNKKIENWKVEEKYNDYSIKTNAIGNNISKNYWYIGIKLKYKNIEFICGIGWDNINSKPYYGLTSRGTSYEKVKDENRKIILELTQKEDNFRFPSERWYAWKTEKLDYKFIDNYINFCKKTMETKGISF